MTPQEDKNACERKCWQLAGAAGVALFVILWAVTSLGFVVSAIIGILAFVIVGLALNHLWCTETAEASEVAATPEVAAAPEVIAAPEEDTSPEDTGPENAGPENTGADKVEDAAPSPAAAEPKADPTQSTSDSLVTPSTPLPGEAELAARKGEWRYGEAETAETPAPDGPARLDKPRGGQGDDLKLIKGVGPKLETLLNSMGFHHFDQIAVWSAAEVAWVDDNLKGFKGRATRDDWVAQAKILAAGGETEFSKRSKG